MKRFFVLTILVIFVFVTKLAFAGPEPLPTGDGKVVLPSEPPVVELVRPWVGVESNDGDGMGMDDVLLTMEAFVPVYQNSRHLFFANGRLVVSHDVDETETVPGSGVNLLTEDEDCVDCNPIPANFTEDRVLRRDDALLSASAGGGYRYYSQNMDRIFGVNAFYDYRDTGISTFNQVGVGIETLGKFFDFRANGYIVVGDDKKSYGESFRTGDFVGQNVDLIRTVFNEVALTGGEGEIGVPIIAHWGLKGYVGGYYYNGPDDDGFGGVKGRLEERFTDDFDIGVTVSHDEHFGVSAMFSAAYRFGGGHAKKGAARNIVVARRADRVQRNQQIVVTKDQDVSSIIATNLAGTPIEVVHVDSAAAPGGDGTVEHPFMTLGQAQAGSVPDDIIFAHAASIFNGQSIVLQDNQRFLGEGVQHFILTPQGTFLLPGMIGGAQPQIFGPTNTTVVTLANNNEVRNFFIRAADGVANAPTGSTAIDVGSGHTALIRDVTAIGGNGFFLDVIVSNNPNAARQLIPNGVVDGEPGADGDPMKGVDAFGSNGGAGGIGIVVGTGSDLTLCTSTVFGGNGGAGENSAGGSATGGIGGDGGPGGSNGAGGDGGAGGAGGAATGGAATGGAGGEGGDAVVVTSATLRAKDVTLTGGTGGAGGSAFGGTATGGAGGAGGAGGDAHQTDNQTGTTIAIDDVVPGGNGGIGGAGGAATGGAATGGVGEAGGHGLFATDSNIILDGVTNFVGGAGGAGGAATGGAATGGLGGPGGVGGDASLIATATNTSDVGFTNFTTNVTYTPIVTGGNAGSGGAGGAATGGDGTGGFGGPGGTGLFAQNTTIEGCGIVNVAGGAGGAGGVGTGGAATGGNGGLGGLGGTASDNIGIVNTITGAIAGITTNYTLIPIIVGGSSGDGGAGGAATSGSGFGQAGGGGAEAMVVVGGSADFSDAASVTITGGDGGMGGNGVSGVANGGAGGNAPQSTDPADLSPSGDARFSHAIIENISGSVFTVASNILYVPIVVGGSGGDGGAGGAALSGAGMIGTAATGGVGGSGGTGLIAQSTTVTLNNATITGGAGGNGGDAQSGEAFGGAGGVASAGGDAAGDVASGMVVQDTYAINGGSLNRTRLGIPLIFGGNAGDGGAGGAADSETVVSAMGGSGGTALESSGSTVAFTGPAVIAGGAGGNGGTATTGNMTGGAGGSAALPGDVNEGGNEFIAYTAIPTVTNTNASILSTDFFLPIVFGGDGGTGGAGGAAGVITNTASGANGGHGGSAITANTGSTITADAATVTGGAGGMGGNAFSGTATGGAGGLGGDGGDGFYAYLQPGGTYSTNLLAVISYTQTGITSGDEAGPGGAGGAATSQGTSAGVGGDGGDAISIDSTTVSLGAGSTVQGGNGGRGGDATGGGAFGGAGGGGGAGGNATYDDTFSPTITAGASIVTLTDNSIVRGDEGGAGGAGGSASGGEAVSGDGGKGGRAIAANLSTINLDSSTTVTGGNGGNAGDGNGGNATGGNGGNGGPGGDASATVVVGGGGATPNLNLTLTGGDGGTGGEGGSATAGAGTGSTGGDGGDAVATSGTTLNFGGTTTGGNGGNSGIGTGGDATGGDGGDGGDGGNTSSNLGPIGVGGAGGLGGAGGVADNGTGFAFIFGGAGGAGDTAGSPGSGGNAVAGSQTNGTAGNPGNPGTIAFSLGASPAQNVSISPRQSLQQVLDTAVARLLQLGQSSRLTLPLALLRQETGDE